MTIEDVIRSVAGFTGEDVTAETKLRNVVSDSLDFVDLILHVSNECGDIPDSAVPNVETVNDLYLAASGQLV